MAIHLVIPPSGYIAQRWKEGISMPPLGILYIAAVLEQNGFPVRVTAADALGLGFSQILAEIEENRAGIVGLTITTENRFEIFNLARSIKRAFPDKLLVIGGPHATMAGEDMIRHIPEIDLAVVGEGEMTMLEIAQWQASGSHPEELEKIKGLIIRCQGRPFFTGSRPPTEDLDSLPFPAKHLVPIDKYNFYWEVKGERIQAANLITSRGCPFNCNFCSTPVNWGRRVRGYSPGRVIQEIRWNMERFGARYIWFYDDTFNYNPLRAAEICDEIIRQKLSIQFVTELRIDTLTYELLAKLKEAGCHYISFGLEAGSERVRRDIVHKQIPTQRLYDVLGWAQKLDLVTTAFFIFSHPTETWSEAQETVRIIEQISDRSEVAVSILHIYPGTELEAYAREKQILPRDFSWSKPDRRVPMLPAAQGNVPLFKDQLSWAQIGELLTRWSSKSKKSSIWRKIPDIVRSLRSPRDILVYATFAWAFVKTRLKYKKAVRP